jgi:hypothetical protein
MVNVYKNFSSLTIDEQVEAIIGMFEYNDFDHTILFEAICATNNVAETTLFDYIKNIIIQKISPTSIIDSLGMWDSIEDYIIDNYPQYLGSVDICYIDELFYRHYDENQFWLFKGAERKNQIIISDIFRV